MKRSGLLGVTLALAVGLALTVLPGIARAQQRGEEVPELSRDWTIRAGFWFFNSNTARNKVGTVGISALAERRVYQGNGYNVEVGIGYNGLDTVYSVPIMVDIIASQHNMRWGGGVGYEFGKRISGRGTSGPALDLILGYEFVHGRNPLSVDLRYYFNSGSSNELDGFGLTLGIKL